MAERRMFHSTVVGSDAFMDLPVGAQALYFHLGMQADDDGFINCPKQVARRLKRPQKDLQLLIDKAFLLEFDGIVVLRHWLVANTLKTDRMKEPRYPQVAEQIFITENREYIRSSGGKYRSLLEIRREKLESVRNPKVREGKKREENIKEANLTQVSVSPPGEPVAHAPDTDSQLKMISGKLGKGVVYLSDAQVEDLLNRMDIGGFDVYVERLANFIIKNNATVANHYKTILKWWEEDKGVKQ